MSLEVWFADVARSMDDETLQNEFVEIVDDYLDAEEMARSLKMKMQAFLDELKKRKREKLEREYEEK